VLEESQSFVGADGGYRVVAGDRHYARSKK